MSSPTHAIAAAAPPAKSSAPFVNPARMMRLQRACACGGQCDSCKNKPEPKPMLQRKAMPGAASPSPAMRAPSPSVAATAPAAAVPKAAPAFKPAEPKTLAPATNAKDKALSTVPGKDAPKSASAAITEKKKASDANSDLPPIVRRVLDTPGEPLDFATRTEMESRFGHSFRSVRIHTDSLAAESARGEYAHAYTVGEHIVFDSGQYRPETNEGKHLLAHELAHTIQQHGLQKSGGPIPTDQSGDYQHLEREADAAASAVLHRPPTAGAPVSPARAAQTRLSRGKKTSQNANQQAAQKKDKKDSWVDVDEGTELANAGVAKISRSKDNPNLVAVQMRAPFIVPAKKGPQAKKLWQAQADAKALQAIMAPGGSQRTTETALKQDRPDTDALRDLWLLKMGWKAGDVAEGLWKEAATKAGYKAANSTFFPSTRIEGKLCDLDHILELQFGGNNIPANIQVLDYAPNRSSGASVGAFLKSKAYRISQALAKDDPTVQPETLAIRMQFNSVKLSTEVSDPDAATDDPPECRCCNLEANAKKGSQLDPNQKGGSDGTRYALQSGAFSVCMVYNKEKTLLLRDSTVAPENKAASTLVPGLQLLEWKPPANLSGLKTCADTPDEETEAPAQAAPAKGKGSGAKGKAAAKAPSHAGGIVTAGIDPKSRVLGKPLEIKQPEKPIEIARDGDGRLAIAQKTQHLGFIVNYLSEGHFSRLAVGEDGSLSGAGQITPSVPFLPKPIYVEFDKDRFVMSAQVKKPQLPIPGAEITEASIGLQLAPEFKPEGKVGFRVGKNLLHGLLTVSADANGLVVDGDIFATIPGTDEVKGNLTLKNKEWSGGIDIKAGGNGKIKYVKSVDVAIRFTQDKGMSATGEVMLAVPGVTEPVKASVHYDRDGWALRGKGRFNPPRIKPVDIEIEYANGSLSGEARTGFEFHTLKGDIHVIYRDGMFSGDADLGIKTDRAEGSIKVEMHHRPNGDIYFTGDGHISFKVTDDLVASAGVKLDEQEKVTVMGELAFNKPITLFKGFSGSYKFFDIDKDIPLPPPLSIGGLGLNVNIQGSLSAGYSVGPVELRDVKATTQFQPLEKDPALVMDLTSRLVIGASASITGTIKGGISLSVVVASISGDLGITATATLLGGMDIPFHAHYADGKITADLGFDAKLKLILALALIASVEAKAGIGWLSVKTGKEWTLGSFTYDPGLTLGMSLKKPIHYESPANFTLPSVDDIAWVTPTLDGKKLVSSAASATPDSQEHDA